MFPKATDETLTQKLVKNCSASQYFKATQGHGHTTTFTVLHYAGEVSCVTSCVVEILFLNVGTNEHDWGVLFRAFHSRMAEGRNEL